MKRPQSNALRQELAKGNSAEPHLDEDVLTAFAEHALMELERERVMEHLATCMQCREVLSLAVAAMPEAVIQEKLHMLPVRPPLRSWFPWVAIAAGVAVVGSAVLLHERNAQLRQQYVNSAVNTAKVEAAPPLRTPPPPQSVMAPERGAVRRQSPTQAAKAAPSRQQDQSSTVAADRLEKKEAPVQAEIAQTNQSLAMDAAKPKIASQPEVVNGAISAQAKSKASSAMNRAAPAPAFSAGAASGLLGGIGGISARAHWRINAAGQAERSFGNEAWAPAMPDDNAKMRVVSVFGSEVWLGGEKLRLYHSIDNGTTWLLVQLPNKDNGEHAITIIHLQGGHVATVEADDGTQWDTIDGGQTWK